MDKRAHNVCWDLLFEEFLIEIFHSWRCVAHYPDCWDSVHSFHHERFVNQYIKETVITHSEECWDSFPNSSYHERFVDQYTHPDRLLRESEYMLRHVGGGAESIWVHPSADDTMVQMIADRCPLIESISLRYCDGISPAALRNLIHTCKHLKLIDVESCSAISPSLIEEMGQYCPSLVGINLGNLKVTEEAATAMGKFMPKLKWLNLNGATISCEDLCMILDSCTELDHISVKSCHRLIMKEKLKNRAARIAEFN